jgi:hypothetical protein
MNNGKKKLYNNVIIAFPLMWVVAHAILIDNNDFQAHIVQKKFQSSDGPHVHLNRHIYRKI